jgi:hypothetical protein
VEDVLKVLAETKTWAGNQTKELKYTVIKNGIGSYDLLYMQKIIVQCLHFCISLGPPLTPTAVAT